MKIKVLLFGIVKEIAGSPTIEIELDEPNVDSLLVKLHEKHQELKQLKSVLVAVNNEYATGDMNINPNDEVAVIPPVAGG